MKTCNFVMSSHINNVRITVDNVLGYYSKLYGNIDDNTLFELKVILNELLLNAIRHGNKGDLNKNVAVAARVIKGFAYLAIKDEGCGCKFDYLFNKHYDSSCAQTQYELKETGRGLFIVKSLCNKLKFNKKGNKVTVLKKLSGECI